MLYHYLSLLYRGSFSLRLVTMFRYRRYRVFLVFAVITIFALYKFGRSSTTWRDAASTAAELKNEAEDALGFGHKPRPALAHDTKKLEVHIPAASGSLFLQTPPPVKVFSTPSPPSPPPATRPPQQKPTVPTPTRPRPHGRPPPVGAGYDTISIAAIHWTKLPENFPVPPQSLMKLPTGKSKAIPKIQAKFAPEDDIAKANRLNKLGTIKSVFRRSWEGYRKYAWEHDELKPASGQFRDPFANWRATLVDALDTLWIMGLKEEFEEAVKAVEEIDFTTTTRADIPLFETTIRYLGGLLAAYDVSGAKYDTLLKKAVELAEVLISAFDTPNRMPETYYYWRPQFSSQKHRAPSRAVLAEIGSLSMEFTRLAQLTGEHKYYDAVARITDHLEEYQNNTRLPGMWPTLLDTSGCGKPPIDFPIQAPLLDPDLPSAAPAGPSPTNLLSPEGNKFIPLSKPDPVVFKPATGVKHLQTPSQKTAPILASPAADSMSGSTGLSPEGNKFVPLQKPDPIMLKPATPSAPDIGVVRDWQGKPLERRQLEVDPGPQPPVAAQRQDSSPIATNSPMADTPRLPECVPQGFKSTSEYGREEYTLGGMSDSTYEYLPKQYLLLGGQVEKYRKMYEDSADIVKKHLIFRPMLPDNNDVLMCGKLNVPSLDHDGKIGDLTGENAHLTCFAGGMFGMAAKMFDRPEDLEIAKKLTEGCVLSYSMTPSGIMPESFEVLPCDDAKECSWNETLYWDTLDPQAEYRATTYKEQIQLYRSQIASASSWYEAQLAAMTAPPTRSADAAFSALPAMPTLVDTLDKRQLVDLTDEAEVAASAPSPSAPERRPAIAEEDQKYYVDTSPSRTVTTPEEDGIDPVPSRVLPVFPYVYSPSVPLNHKDFVESRIQEERLPPGMTKIGSRDYILR